MEDEPDISIHAPHARSDKVRPKSFTSTCYFNPRSSCEERPWSVSRVKYKEYFNPRSSCEERHCEHPMLHRERYFNPRSSCEERRERWDLEYLGTDISIHAPHARSDLRQYQARRALRISIHAPHARSDCSSSTLSSLVTDISIHAPHARSDGMGCNSFRTYQHFNPRSSCEERLGSLISRLLDVEFQSTLLMRGATPELQRGL